MVRSGWSGHCGMSGSGVGGGPVSGGRIERLHLGRGPRVRRSPGDRPEKPPKKTPQTNFIILGIGRSIIFHSSSEKPCFLKFPQQGSVEFAAHTILQTALLSMLQTLKYSKPPTLKREVNSCSSAASKSFVFVLRRSASPPSLLFSKPVCCCFFNL